VDSATNVMLFFRSKGVATPLLRKNRKKKTLNLQHYPSFEDWFYYDNLIKIIPVNVENGKVQQV
jgi:hypothetical protein